MSVRKIGKETDVTSGCEETKKEVFELVFLFICRYSMKCLLRDLIQLFSACFLSFLYISVREKIGHVNGLHYQSATD